MYNIIRVCRTCTKLVTVITKLEPGGTIYRKTAQNKFHLQHILLLAFCVLLRFIYVCFTVCLLISVY